MLVGAIKDDYKTSVAGMLLEAEQKARLKRGALGNMERACAKLNGRADSFLGHLRAKLSH